MKRLINSIILLTTILQLCLTVLAQQDLFDKKQNIQNTLGVIVRSKSYGEHDFIKIYNADGSLWYKFTFYYDDKKGYFPYQNDSFRPFTSPMLSAWKKVTPKVSSRLFFVGAQVCGENKKSL